MEEIRFGVLGAARIVPWALIQPARQVNAVDVVAIGARDGARAQAFAQRHGIGNSAAGYEAVLANPTVNAVYVALPNSMHATWAVRALQAGKHVLCEKPLAANADEAASVAEVAAQSGRVLMEAFHWRYHPLALRLIDLVRDPAAGPIVSMYARFRTPVLRRDDIRFHYVLGGGALMDMGCYLVHMVRTLAGEEPAVEEAHATLLRPLVDKRMSARLRFPSGALAHLDCEMGALRWPQVDLEVRCTHRTLQVVNPILPHVYNALRVAEGGVRRRESFARTPTYVYQLRAFADAVRTGASIPTNGADAVRNMLVVDAIYRAAGLPRRGEPLSTGG